VQNSRLSEKKSDKRLFFVRTGKVRLFFILRAYSVRIQIGNPTSINDKNSRFP